MNNEKLSVSRIFFPRPTYYLYQDRTKNDTHAQNQARRLGGKQNYAGISYAEVRLKMQELNFPDTGSIVRISERFTKYLFFLNSFFTISTNRHPSLL